MDNIREVMEVFQTDGAYVSHVPYGSGHINTTLLVDCVNKKYILQRINITVFKKPAELMANIAAVTGFLRNKGVPTLNIIPTKSGGNMYAHPDGSFWRVFDFISDSKSYDIVEDAGMFMKSGMAFGEFQKHLSDFPVQTLHETIVDFHFTPKRLDAFKAAVEANPLGRVDEVKKEIDFILQRQNEYSLMTDMVKRNELPIRVTHNDTKFNNVLFNHNNECICVIDLDTVMPGLAGNDFGDAIRFGCNPCAEDEPDLSVVNFNIDYFKAYATGFISICGKNLTANEIKTLPLGAKLMTLECGTRFLTDYISGDVYFKIHHPKQNLDRCRTQFKLVADMEACFAQLNEATLTLFDNLV